MGASPAGQAAEEVERRILCCSRTGDNSISDAHARSVNKLFRVMIDLPAAAPPILMNVKRVSLHGGDGRRRQVNFVFHRLTVICELQLRMIDAVELPKHPDEIGLSAK